MGTTVRMGQVTPHRDGMGTALERQRSPWGSSEEGMGTTVETLIGRQWGWDGDSHRDSPAEGVGTPMGTEWGEDRDRTGTMLGAHTGSGMGTGRGPQWGEAQEPPGGWDEDPHGDRDGRTSPWGLGLGMGVPMGTARGQPWGRD